MLKITFPVGTTVPVAGVTDAAKVSALPAVAGFSLEVSSVAVEGLYPGANPAVTVKVKDKDANQAEFLTKLEAEVEKTSAAECKKEWFVVSPASQEPKVLLAHGETKEYTVHLEMKEEAAVNQNACKGASVTLKYKAS